MNPIEKIESEKLFAVIRMNDTDRVRRVIETLAEGGIKIVEIIVEIPEMIEVIKDITKQENRPMIMAGGIITQRQAHIAMDSGADVIVSPVYQMSLVRLCKSRQTPLIMTATTPNEAYEAWMAGTKLIKISPANPMGGAEYIEDILRPMKFLNIIASGSIKTEDIPAYLAAGAKAVGLGRALCNDSNLSVIKQKAQEAYNKVHEIYGHN